MPHTTRNGSSDNWTDVINNYESIDVPNMSLVAEAMVVAQAVAAAVSLNRSKK